VVALDTGDGTPRLVERREIQVSAVALWMATWLWRLAR
jgi:hypothetical protein